MQTQDLTRADELFTADYAYFSSTSSGWLARRCSVTAYDPLANANFKHSFSTWPIRYAETMADAVGQAEAVVVVTRWREFGELTAMVAGMETPPLVVDGRRMFEAAAFPRYTGIGIEMNPSSEQVSSLYV